MYSITPVLYLFFVIVASQQQKAIPGGSLYRELLSRDFGEDDGPVIRGVTRPSNLPDASKME